MNKPMKMNMPRHGPETLFVHLTGAHPLLNFQLLPADEKQKKIKCQQNYRN